MAKATKTLKGRTLAALVTESSDAKAVAAIEARWKVPEQPSNDGLFEYLKNNPEWDREKGE